MQRRPFTIQEGPVHIVPVCHHRVEFARYVRLAIQEVGPRAVAVELPTELRELYTDAIERFPKLSLLANRNPEESGEDRFVFHRVEPTDPLCEAIRTGTELDLPVHFIDLDVADYPAVHEPIPDTYAVYRLGLKTFWEQYAAAQNRDLSGPLDTLRERHMARHLRRLSEHGTVLLVCGMAHVAGILEALRERTDEFAEARSRARLQLYNPDLDTIRSLSGEMPLVMTLYELVRGGPGPEDAWVDPTPPEPQEPQMPPGLAGMSSQDVFAAVETLLGMAPKREEPLRLSLDQLRALHRYLSSFPDPRLAIPGLFPTPEGPSLEGAPPVAPQALRAFKFKTCHDRRSQLRGLYDELNAACRGDDRFLDRQKVLHQACLVAGAFYEENTGDTFKRWQHRVLTQFARNYARMRGMLMPDLFQLAIAARSSVDHNYAYELWDLLTFYPWAAVDDSVPPIHIGADGVEIDGLRFRTWTFHRKLPRLRQQLSQIGGRRNEERPGEWAQEFSSGRICSYPPEDIVIEDYGRYLQRKGIQVLSEERVRVEPFSTSLLDGIDMRTTLRNWADGQKIYVREAQKAQGGAGSVVIVFDEDREDRRYPWKMTWHGEHSQESDMAFFATPPTHKIVGPGIARCEYGGLMLTYPPRRLADVWSDPFYSPAQTKAEVLLFAALDYCVERHVVYVASSPPRTFFRTLAGRMGKKIVYLPIGQLSPVSVNKIRVFHVLSGHRLREIAKDYIW